MRNWKVKMSPSRYYLLITLVLLLSACGQETPPAPTGVQGEAYPPATTPQSSPVEGHPPATAGAPDPTHTPLGASLTGTPGPVPTKTPVATSPPLPTPDVIGTPDFDWQGPGIVYQSVDLTLSNFDGSQKNRSAGVPRLQPWNSDFSPEAGRIVYASGNALWILDLGKGAQSILSADRYIESGVISADGARIAYSLVSGPQAEYVQLWTVNADGSENTLVADDTGRYITDSGPFRLAPVAWSPDKSQIYMTTTTDSEATPVGMYVADVATGSIEKALTPQVTLWDLAFSPDRTMVAYRTFQWLPVEGSMPEPGPPFTLQVTDLATGKTTVLQESDTFEYYHPVWSPDGRHIAYSARSAQPAEEIGLFTIDLATGIATRLVPGSEGRQLRPWAWLGTDRIVYTETGGASEYGGDPAVTLYTIKTDGSEQHVVETAGAMFVLGTLEGPPWARSRVRDAQLVSAGQGWALEGERLLWTADAAFCTENYPSAFN